MKTAHDHKVNYTIWFGHFPTSCVLIPSGSDRGIRGLIGQYPESVAYLSGHFHTLGNIVPRMYTLHHEGFLELELGDWMRNRLYRVAAIDHGLFSFVDIKHNTWPVILITNPKNVVFNAPAKENPLLQSKSTHIRLLAFSTSPIVKCEVKINGGSWSACQQKTENLFVLKWEPQRYSTGKHEIKARVTDAAGLQRTVSHYFALDGSRVPFDIMARLVLMGDFHSIVKVFFFIAVGLCTIPLCSTKIWHYLVIKGHARRPDFKSKSSWIKRIWILSTLDWFFFLIVAYCLYLTVGPWSFGEVIDNHFSVVFVWGVLVNGALLPGSLNYLQGFFQLIICQLPLINIYAGNVYRKFRSRKYEDDREVGLCHKLKRHLPFTIIMTVEIFLSSIFFYEYGTLAFLIAPMRTWANVMNIYLYYKTLNLPETDLRSASIVWSHEPKPASTQD